MSCWEEKKRAKRKATRRRSSFFPPRLKVYRHTLLCRHNHTMRTPSLFLLLTSAGVATVTASASTEPQEGTTANVVFPNIASYTPLTDVADYVSLCCRMVDDGCYVVGSGGNKAELISNTPTLSLSLSTLLMYRPRLIGTSTS